MATGRPPTGSRPPRCPATLAGNPLPRVLADPDCKLWLAGGRRDQTAIVAAWPVPGMQRTRARSRASMTWNLRPVAAAGHRASPPRRDRFHDAGSAVLARRRYFGWPGPECAEPAVLARRRGEGSDQVCARFLGLASHVAGESATDNAGEMPRAGTQVAWPARTCQRGGLPGARFRRFFAPSCGARPACCAGLPAWCCQGRAVVQPLSRAGATPAIRQFGRSGAARRGAAGLRLA